MSASTLLVTISEPDERLWPWPCTLALRPTEYGEERSPKGDETVRRREGMLGETEPPNADQLESRVEEEDDDEGVDEKE